MLFHNVTSGFNTSKHTAAPPLKDRSRVFCWRSNFCQGCLVVRQPNCAANWNCQLCRFVCGAGRGVRSGETEAGCWRAESHPAGEVRCSDVLWWFELSPVSDITINISCVCLLLLIVWNTPAWGRCVNSTWPARKWWTRKESSQRTLPTTAKSPTNCPLLHLTASWPLQMTSLCSVISTWQKLH